MSATTATPPQAARAQAEPRAMSGPRRRRLLPFSPWHLLLAPLSLLFALPLLFASPPLTGPRQYQSLHLLHHVVSL